MNLIIVSLDEPRRLLTASEAKDQALEQKDQALEQKDQARTKRQGNSKIKGKTGFN